jgi:hypothetical protein
MDFRKVSSVIVNSFWKCVRINVPCRLKRDSKTNHFRDEDLARILQNATEWSAGAFKARGTPEVMRVIEILAIEQSRSWGTCSVYRFLCHRPRYGSYFPDIDERIPEVYGIEK